MKADFSCNVSQIEQENNKLIPTKTLL